MKLMQRRLDGTAFCHFAHGFFNTFDERTASHGNTLRPSAFPFRFFRWLYSCAVLPAINPIGVHFPIYLSPLKAHSLLPCSAAHELIESMTAMASHLACR
jgi:hypothetical protein